MLVIGRRLGEYIVIDNNIIVKVIKSADGNLRLAIDAPKDVKIIRGELNKLKEKEEIITI